MSKLSVISPKGLSTLLKSSIPSSRVIPIDATWYMPNSPFNGKKKFLEEERLPKAAFFDLDAIALANSKYPHMLPTFAHFNKSLTALGVSKTDKLVVYDKEGIFSSPRAAWNLTLFGHQEVYLLNNYANYKKDSYELDTAPVTSEATSAASSSSESYESISESEWKKLYKSQVIEFEELLELVKSKKLGEEYVTFDARSNDRFTGEAPEPRPGLPSGHVPSSLSLPFTKLLNEDKTYKSKDELLQIFRDDFDLDFSSSSFPKKNGIIVMCGTGVTAVILRVAIESIIGSDVPIRVYDGSWTEWAQRAPAEYIVKSK